MNRRARSFLVLVIGVAGLTLGSVASESARAQPASDAAPDAAITPAAEQGTPTPVDSVATEPEVALPVDVAEPAAAMTQGAQVEQDAPAHADELATPEPTEPTPAPADVSSLPASRVDLRRIAAIEGTVAVQLISRHFRYTDDVYGFLRPYTLPAGPAIALDARWYPGAHWSRGIASSFGVDVRFDRSFGIESERNGTLRYPTVVRLFEASALGRFSYRGHAFVASLGYGNHAFTVSSANAAVPGLNPVPDVPSIAYSYLRYGLEARIVPHDRLGVIAGFAYLQVLSTGGISSDVWFPRNEAGGVAMNAALVVGLPHHLELRGGVEYRRYFHSMHSREGDPFIAGGALDQYATFHLGVTYRR